MNRLPLIGVVGLLGLTQFGCNHAAQRSGLAHVARAVDETHEQRIREAYGRVPLAFEANEGQTDPEVRFLTRGPSYTMFLTPTETVLVLEAAAPPTRREVSGRGHSARMATPDSAKTVAVRMRLVGANPDSVLRGRDALTGRSNYFIGNDPKHWQTDVATYARVEYRQIYPAIDLLFHGDRRRLEYDFIVAPGADPSAVTLAFDGPERLQIDAAGSLILETAVGRMYMDRPRFYQESNRGRQQIRGGYVMKGTGRIGFQIDSYDVTKTLVIDPTYSTYLGGSADDEGTAIAIDAAGNAYVSGKTQSANFPKANAQQPTISKGGLCGPLPVHPCPDAFVLKLNASGSALVYSTFLGGSGPDDAWAIAVDSGGNAYVAGATVSPDFPVTAGACQPAFGGAFDAFVTKFGPSGGQILYSTYLGGTKIDDASGIAVDSSGNAYVAGETASTNFPVTGGAFQATSGGGDDAFVAKVNTTATGAASLVYSTYLGGSGSDFGSAIAVDGSGGAYISGGTASTNFPVTPGAFQGAFAGAMDAFMAKLNTGAAGAASLVYSTYLGGSSSERADGIAVDSGGNAYVVGTTSSINFPTYHAVQPTAAGATDAFVTKLNPAASGASSLIYSTYLGGSAWDTALAVAVDSSGNVYVTGQAGSTDFPTKRPLQPANAGGIDAFVTKVNAAGSDFVYSTYLGGSGLDRGMGIAVDARGNAYVTGRTESANFALAGAVQGALSGPADAFVTKLSPEYRDRLSFLRDAGTLTHVNFDKDPCGTPIAAPSPGVQAAGLYSAVGVNFTAGVIFNVAALGQTTSSSPNIVTNSGINTPTPALVDGTFASPVFAVGMTNQGAQSILRVFDAANALVGSITSDADPLTKDFIGLISTTPIQRFQYDFVSGIGFGGDDLLFSTIMTTICPLPSGPPLACMAWAGTNLFICPDQTDIRIVDCLTRPFGMCRPYEPRPPLCGLVPCPPCLSGLSCSGTPFEVLFDTRTSDLRIALQTSEGATVATATRLERPTRVEKRVFNQQLRFRADPGQTYVLSVLSGDGTKPETAYPLDVLLRGAAR